jgi:hypothetical protein
VGFVLLCEGIQAAVLATSRGMRSRRRPAHPSGELGAPARWLSTCVVGPWRRLVVGLALGGGFGVRWRVLVVGPRRSAVGLALGGMKFRWHGVRGWRRQDLEVLVLVLVVGWADATLQWWRGQTGIGGRLDLGRGLWPLVHHPCIGGL